MFTLAFFALTCLYSSRLALIVAMTEPIFTALLSKLTTAAVLFLGAAFAGGRAGPDGPGVQIANECEIAI